MFDSSNSNSDQICRICLTPASDLTLIFEGNDSNISNILMSLAMISIIQNDGMPQKICTLCVHQANSAHYFILKCKESDQKLRGNLTDADNATDLEIDESFADDDTIEETISFNEDIEFGKIEYECKDMKKISAEEVVTTNNYKLKYNECTEVFSNADNVNQTNYECIECRKMFTTNEFLIEHMKIHKRKCYECSQCSQKYTRLNAFNEHLKRHIDTKSLICGICHAKFTSQVRLERHTEKHNQNKQKTMHKCSICGKEMKYVNNLTLHMRTHRDSTGAPVVKPTTVAQTASNNRKDLLCTICGKVCSSRSNMAVHMRRHSGQMSCFCSICHKGYPRTTDLTIHMRKHTGEKPFVCKFCNRGFARSDKLAIHVRIHTKEKPYGCTCGRAFAQSNDLASHKKRNVCGSCPQQAENQK